MVLSRRAFENKGGECPAFPRAACHKDVDMIK